MLNNSIYTHPCAEKGPRQNMKFSLCLFKKKTASANALFFLGLAYFLGQYSLQCTLK